MEVGKVHGESYNNGNGNTITNGVIGKGQNKNKDNVENLLLDGSAGYVEESDAAIYEKYAADRPYDKDRVRELIEQTNRQNDAFMQMVIKTVLNQGKNASAAQGAGSIQVFSKDFMEKIAAAADPETIKKAQSEIAPGGYYSVEETSKRILDFAKAITGGDASKIDLMQESILKGFDKAQAIWGGELPEISSQTKQAVLDGLNEWRAQAAGQQTSKEVVEQAAAQGLAATK